ncbi:hypothetical protein [Nocardioides conyzicola]|uniref:WXG100 family type VII secretion target n=1 Tax=Nocardioides conyzicola TaxID=1651781 RepID=A0ABP8X4T0_9ACTN
MSEALTPAAVAAWDPSKLVPAADAVRAAKKEVGAGVDTLVATRTDLLAAWQGDGGEAAAAAVGHQVHLGDQLAAVLGQAVHVLQGGCDALTSARDKVVTCLAAASADGCRVDDDGTVHGPSVPDYAYSSDATTEQVESYREAYDEKVAASDALATEHADAIRDALVAAGEADQQLASSLDALLLPPEVADTAYDLLQRLGGEGLGNSLLPVTFPESWDPMDAFRSGDREDWLRQVGLEACFPALYSGDDDLPEDGRLSGYQGGGFIEGPDGRMYPLVAPQVMIDGHPYGADSDPGAPRIQDLNGSDDGWHLIGRHSGYDQLDEVHGSDKVAVVLGGVAGGDMSPAGDLIRRTDLAGDLHLNDAGFPTLDGGHTSHALPELPEDASVEADADLPGVNPDRVGRIGGGLDLAISGTEGFLAAQGIDDNAHHAYVVSLEQNDDGRIRALLNVYDVFESRDSGDAVIQSSYGWVDSDGDLVKQPYNFHHSQSSIGPADVSYYGVR